jgi:hypothetical protein
MFGIRPAKFSTLAIILAYLSAIALSGCSLIPDVQRKPQYSNPFPQITRVAILPFYNQSDDPTLDGSSVALAYFNEMQTIPGFEVLPIGVIENALVAFGSEPRTAREFQEFARFVGADAVLVGAVTDYNAYYPPRATLRVNWYAANPAFHPIPVGYGLPWGTKKEKKIPSWIKLEAERELAKKQLETQTPYWEDPAIQAQQEQEQAEHEAAEQLAAEFALVQEAFDESSANESRTDGSYPSDGSEPPKPPVTQPEKHTSTPVDAQNGVVQAADEFLAQPGLPSQWPDPKGFIPDAPRTHPPKASVQYEPIISHTRAYNGHDEDITRRLEEYYYFRDDARASGWQAYLKRSEDFMRFCCHMHITETLSSRGGELESRLIFRWPIGRYQR